MNSSWRTKLIWLLAAVAFLVLLVAGFYAEENARGLRAWEQCQRDLAARGESLEWTNFIPTPVPDDQNFFKAPMIATWFTEEPTNSAHTLYSILKIPSTFTNDITKTSATNYLAWCSSFDSIFNEIQNALQRPYARLDRDFSGPLDFSPMSTFTYGAVARIIDQRAKCHIVLADSDKAFQDLKFLAACNRTLIGSDKPCSAKTGTTYAYIIGRYVDAVAFGLNSHIWTEQQVSEFQKQLAEINVLQIEADWIRNLSATKCHEIDTIFAKQQAQRPDARYLDSFDWWLMPTGWLVKNKVIVYSIQEQMLSRFDVTNHLVWPVKAKNSEIAIDKLVQKAWPDDFTIIVGTISSTRRLEGVAFVQTQLDQALIACALERYRLAHGQYPHDLATLVPQYLAKIPSDIINGKPMTYVRKDDQHFLLYSVGWNEADDDGTIAHDSDGNEDRDHGDWVWH